MTLDKLLEKGKSFKEINNIVKYLPQPGWYYNGLFIPVELLYERNILMSSENGIDKRIVSKSDNFEYIDMEDSALVLDANYILPQGFINTKISKFILLDIKIIGMQAFRGSKVKDFFIADTIESLSIGIFMNIDNNFTIFCEKSEKEVEDDHRLVSLSILKDKVCFDSNIRTFLENNPFV